MEYLSWQWWIFAAFIVLLLLLAFTMGCKCCCNIRTYINSVQSRPLGDPDEDEGEYSLSITTTRHGVEDTIGLSLGGAKDVNAFRNCIEQSLMPSIDSITYNGLLYEYYFDTKTRKHIDKNNNIQNQDSMLFYPTYCYAKTLKLSFDNNKNINNDYEYYMSVGLNSNIKQSSFKRKHLNIVILIDKSGSMAWSFDDNTNKMECTIDAVQSILKQLTSNDRLGIVTFNNEAHVLQPLKCVDDINMKELQDKVSDISADGGTDFECGYNKTIALYKDLFMNDNVESKNGNTYDNRVIILTDAQPNQGVTDAHSLLSMISKYARDGMENKEDLHYYPSPTQTHDEEIHKLMHDTDSQRVYTTFIGVGLDFNSQLIQQISETRGCNYYSVRTSQEFSDKMADEFEFMVTPLVFDVCLKLKCEGGSCKIEKVYGSSKDKEESIVNDGEITRIHTLFPSKKSEKTAETKGGIQLMKLIKCGDNDAMNVELEVMYEDRNGNKYKNTQNVTLKAPNKGNNDMIEMDENELDELDVNFYDNIGIRKAILLCKYVELIKGWIQKSNGSMLAIDEYHKNVFINFNKYFENEMVQCKDDTLQKEMDIMKQLINL